MKYESPAKDAKDTPAHEAAETKAQERAEHVKPLPKRGPGNLHPSAIRRDVTRHPNLTRSW
jgi:hypothetical protein